MTYILLRTVYGVQNYQPADDYMTLGWIRSDGLA